MSASSVRETMRTAGIDIGSSAVKAVILEDGETGARVRAFLRTAAQARLAEAVARHCDTLGVTATAITLRDPKGRWGSCTAQGRLMFSWRLVMAPDFVRRSVVAHEVAHLVHFDHSPRFHALLASLYEGDIGEANRWLKREGRTLYLPFG